MKHTLKWIVRLVFIVVLLTAGWLFVAYWRSTNECDRKAGTPSNPIKAIVYCEYGSPDALKLEDVEKPVPNDN